MKGCSHDDLRVFMIISRWILLRMRNVLDGILEYIERYILYTITFFVFENRAVYEMVRENDNARQTSDDNMQWCMRCAWFLIKAADTHTE